MRRKLLLAAAVPLALKALEVAGRALRARGRTGPAALNQRLHTRLSRYRRP
ncbi:hypothetical protein [Arthrobacter sp. CG_A4]|uniref:hypothetical protein n=1 Tax=Arthrobacter sp. CG_A4 TaxID=3071706 RepID=UPI002DFAF6F3|nr:hypothetical protein [Arthrobacter sp. CG_A4]